MNIRTLGLWGIILVLLMHSACQNPVEPEDKKTTPILTNVKGTVLRSDNLSAVPNVIVFDSRGLPKDTTKGDGTFNLKYNISVPSVSKIIAQRIPGFGNDTTTITVNPGRDTTITLKIKADSTSPTTGTLTGKASNIVLVGSSDLNISIRGTGLNETAVLSFEVRDSLGLAISGANKVKVNFSILGGPGGGEYVFPASVDSDPLTGRVTTRVTSGTKAGVLQVYASATVGTNTIKSSPVRVTISGGLPVPERFSMSRSVGNIAGGVFDNLRTRITVVVGDKEGNPVQLGTAIYFTTSGGIVQPSATTNVDGIASVELITGNPRPSNSIAQVTARTIGDSGLVITRTIPILFSGRTTIVGPQTQVIIADSGSTEFNYIVSDPSGFPLVGGTNISVKAEGPGAGELELFGDAARILPDTEDPSFTLFTLKVRDKARQGPAGSVTFKIDVKSQNGDATLNVPGVVLTDTVQPPPPSTIGGGAKSGYASSLTLVGISSTQLSVSGTGANETSTLTFAARDSIGRPVDVSRRAFVTFSISPTGGLGGGEFVSPVGDSTNSLGQVNTTFNAGTRSGVVQIVARAIVLGKTITSSPVRLTIAGGLPDSTRFTAGLSRLNMPGLVLAGRLGTVSVQVGDKFGNPVQPGTALYFSTSGGLIAPTATTNESGQASAGLQGGNPAPNEPSIGGPGFGFVTIQTVGENGVSIRKQLPFLYSGAPVVSVLNVPTDTVRLLDGSLFDVDYRVSDANGNPISSGNSISVSVSGPGAAGVSLSGDVNVTIPDTQDKINGTRFRFRVQDNVAGGGASGDFVFKISVAGESGLTSRTFYGVLQSPQQVQLPPNASARQPAQIAFLGVTATDIFVAGVGALENSVTSYEVRDSLGVPIDKLRRAYATFSLQFFPNSSVFGGTAPRLIPTADSTDDQGRLRVSIVSGSQAGVLQVVSRISLPGGATIVSQPVKVTVHSGFPDRGHFFFSTSSYTFASSGNSVGPTFFVQVGDTFSNPVAVGTAIYFSTQAGLIQTGQSGFTAYTDLNGRAAVSFLGGNPTPDATGTALAGRPTFYQRPGVFWVYTQTQGKDGLNIIDSVRVGWAIAPVVFTGIPVATVNIPRAGSSIAISITVKDARGNPLPVGTTITPVIKFTSDVPGISFGVFGGFSSDDPFVMPNAPYVVDPGPGVTDFTFRVADLSTGGGASLGQSVIVTIRVNAPGLGTFSASFNGQVN